MGFEFQNLLVYHIDGCDDMLYCNCPILEKTDSFKYLRIILDEKLSWKKHITDLHCKIKFSVYHYTILYQEPG